MDADKHFPWARLGVRNQCGASKKSLKRMTLIISIVRLFLALRSTQILRGTVSAVLKAGRVLIIAPASMKAIWAQELRRWLVDSTVPVAIVNSSSRLEDSPARGVWIINYDF
jgi:hypothetical protein